MSDNDKAKAEAEAKAKRDADDKAKAEAEAKAKRDADDKAKAEAEAKAKSRRVYHVPGPGSLHFGGKLYRAGDELKLTDDEADELEDMVKPGTKPAAPTDIAKRRAGKYRVKGPGSMFEGGKIRAAGFEMDLDQDEARKLGNAIEEA
jgi:membrane protein involved in colicin uptake